MFILIVILFSSPTTHHSSLSSFGSWEILHNTAGASGAAIPIGIAVGRQRLQETTTQSSPQIQAKDLNRFGLGLADLGE